MKYVAYYRVSTKDQGKDGYGIQDQEKVVERYVGNNELIASFKETESGSKSDRPELLKALALCKKENATLVIARLDRLARNLYFVAKLQNSKIDFVCCDIPDANKFTIQLLAAVAELVAVSTRLVTAEFRRYQITNRLIALERFVLLFR